MAFEGFRAGPFPGVPEGVHVKHNALTGSSSPSHETLKSFNITMAMYMEKDMEKDERGEVPIHT